jgi:hypothetical protein
MIRMGLPSRVMVGAGLAPALVFPSIRLSIAFANKVLYGRPRAHADRSSMSQRPQANHGGRP